MPGSLTAPRGRTLAMTRPPVLLSSDIQNWSTGDIQNWSPNSVTIGHACGAASLCRWVHRPLARSAPPAA